MQVCAHFEVCFFGVIWNSSRVWSVAWVKCSHVTSHALCCSDRAFVPFFASLTCERNVLLVIARYTVRNVLLVIARYTVRNVLLVTARYTVRNVLLVIARYTVRNVLLVIARYTLYGCWLRWEVCAKVMTRTLDFWRRNYFFLIFEHTVHKMWIIQEPNTLESWNKLHLERRKNGEYIPCLKYSVPIFVE
jgi:hypothetical protein